MNCSTAQQLLQLNRPGERSPAEEVGLRDHLAGCASCAADVERVSRLRGVESAWRTAEIPVPDLRHVRARVLAATAERQQTWGFARLAYVVASLALLGWFITGQATVRLAQSRLQESALARSTHDAGPTVVYAVDTRSVARFFSILPTQGRRTTGMIEVPQSDADDVMRRTEHEFYRASLQGPGQRARLEAITRAVRSSISVAIRFRTPGA